MDKEIVVTGSRGFIGTNLREGLERDFDEIDLSLGSSCRDLHGRTGTLIHLAAWISENESFRNPAKYISNNLEDLSLVLTKNNFDRVIFPSSSAVYDKDGNLEPNSVYGMTKLAGEKLVKTYARNYWILRLANPYGLHDKRSVLAELLKCKKENRAFTIYRNDGTIKDFFPVSHVVRVIDRILAGTFAPGIYDVGSGTPGVRVSFFLEGICQKARIKYWFVDPPVGLSVGHVVSPTLGKTIQSNRFDLEEEWLRFLS